MALSTLNHTCNFWDYIFFGIIFGGSRVTLVVAFHFLLPNLGRRRGPMNGTLSFYECTLSGGDTQRW